MKHTKLLVLALLVVVMACISVSALAICSGDAHTDLQSKYVPATCTTEGYSMVWCQACGATITKTVIPATGHVADGVWVDAKDYSATPCVTHTQYQRCIYFATCGHVFNDAAHTRTVPGDDTKHNWVTSAPAVAANCTTGGFTEKVTCSVCGKLSPDPNLQGKATPALGHKWGAAIQDGSDAYGLSHRATCKDTGVTVNICERCGEYKTTNVAKLSYHVKKNSDGTVTPITPLDGYVQISPKRPATCTDDGCEAVWACPTCGAKDPNRNGQLLPALGHKFVLSSNTLPTCTTRGETIWVCVNQPDLGNGPVKCGHIRVENQPAYGHSATWAPASSAADGSYTIWELRCGRCSTVLASQVVLKGEKAPTGSVNTGATATNSKIATTVKGTTTTAKTTTTKKNNNKTTQKTVARATTQPVVTPGPVDGIDAKEGLNIVEGAAFMVKDGVVTGILAEEGKTLVNAATKVAIEIGANVTEIKIAVVPNDQVVTAVAEVNK